MRPALAHFHPIGEVVILPSRSERARDDGHRPAPPPEPALDAATWFYLPRMGYATELLLLGELDATRIQLWKSNFEQLVDCKGAHLRAIERSEPGFYLIRFEEPLLLQYAVRPEEGERIVFTGARDAEPVRCRIMLRWREVGK